MSIRLNSAAALVAVCVVCAGCSGGLQCGSGCYGSPFAFMKYDAACESCGPGFAAGGCTSGACQCGDACDCGDGCSCGDGSACGSGCTSGCAVGYRGGCLACAGGARRGGWLLAKLCGCSGCGEFYVNEWFNDPPCIEPCDCCGNWIGPGHECTCCSPKPYDGWGAYAPCASLDKAPPRDLGDEPATLVQSGGAAEGTIVYRDAAVNTAVHGEDGLEPTLALPASTISVIDAE